MFENFVKVTVFQSTGIGGPESLLPSSPLFLSVKEVTPVLSKGGHQCYQIYHHESADEEIINEKENTHTTNF